MLSDRIICPYPPTVPTIHHWCLGKLIKSTMGFVFIASIQSVLVCSVCVKVMYIGAAYQLLSDSREGAVDLLSSCLFCVRSGRSSVHSFSQPSTDAGLPVPHPTTHPRRHARSPQAPERLARLGRGGHVRGDDVVGALAPRAAGVGPLELGWRRTLCRGRIGGAEELF